MFVVVIFSSLILVGIHQYMNNSQLLFRVNEKFDNEKLLLVKAKPLWGREKTVFHLDEG